MKENKSPGVDGISPRIGMTQNVVIKEMHLIWQEGDIIILIMLIIIII